MATAPAANSTQHQGPKLPPHSGDVDEELGRIRLALAAVFSPSNSGNGSEQWWAQRQLADQYLTSFQATSVSWMVCDRLLQGDISDVGSDPQKVAQQQQFRFFAAQTLHTKCRADIDQLPTDALPSLRDSLLAHLNRYAADGSEGPLSTRLAMCISALAVQMQWTTVVSDLLATPQNVHVVMLILRALPEECASDRLVLADDAYRFKMRDHLVSFAPNVLQFLHAHVTDASRVLKVLHLWIRYVPVHPQTLVESPLLNAAVQALRQPAYIELASDVIVEILRMYPSHHYGNEGLVRHMIPLLSSLPLDEALQSDDEDVLRAYCRVVTEMGESYMSLILSPQYLEASQLVSWVLKCSGMANQEIASITLHFWYRLVMDLESVDPYDWRQELIDAYTPHLLQLIDVCIKSLMRYPADMDTIPEDLLDELTRHRFYVAETVEDCCRLLGGQNVLQRIGNLLQQEIHAASGNQVWQGLESCLACIGAIHRFVPSDEAELLPLTFQLVPQLPTEIRPLRYTASKTIGKFASWLAFHPHLLQPLMPYLAQGLSVPECAPAAAVAIKELCECSNQSFAIAEPVMELFQGLTPGTLEVEDELQILEGVCRALSRQMQDARGRGNDTQAALTRLAQPIGTRLAASVSEPNSSPRRIIPEIERLTVLVRYLVILYDGNATTGLHPMLELTTSIWSFLDAAVIRFPGDIVLAEKICRLHKHSLRSCGAQAYSPMLDRLMTQLVQSFERSHQSPFLYAASICIAEYGSDSTYSNRLLGMVSAMATTCFSFLRNVDELTAHPDVVEELFYMMGRMMSNCPDPLVQSPLLRSLLQCAAVGMQLDHHGANKGTLKFLENTISYGLSLREQKKPACQAPLEEALSQEGQAIVVNLMKAMMGDLPEYGNSQIPEILWKLNLLCPGLLTQWLHSAFAGTLTLPEGAKNDFIAALDTGLARDEFSMAVRAFQTACERHRRLRKGPRRN
jgi:transportin-3